MNDATEHRTNGVEPTTLPRTSDEILRSWSTGPQVHRSTDQVPDLHGPVDLGPRTSDLQVPDLDPKAVRAKVRAETKVQVADAAADRKLRTRSARSAQRLAARRADRTETDADRRARMVHDREVRAEKTRVRAEKSKARRDLWTSRRSTASAAAPATLSMLVYGAAVASAVFGQVSVATTRYHWWTGRALILAGFIELMALAMATTANRLRLRGERAMAPRILTWVFAGFASAVNIWGHWGNPLMATGLGAASLGGITLWEIRSSAKHRDELRKLGMIGQPMTHFGWRGWLIYRGRTWRAWKLDVLGRMTPTAAALLTIADQQDRAERYRQATLRTANEALRVASGAAKSGKPGPALDALKTYAQVLRTYAESEPTWTREVLPLGSTAEVQEEVRTSDSGPAVYQVQDPSPSRSTAEVQVLTPSPEDCKPRMAKVHKLTAKSNDEYLDEVRRTYPDPAYVPTWSEVQRSINAVKVRKGLEPTRSGATIRKVLDGIRAERSTTHVVNE